MKKYIVVHKGIKKKIKERCLLGVQDTTKTMFFLINKNRDSWYKINRKRGKNKEYFISHKDLKILNDVIKKYNKIKSYLAE